VFVTHDQEEALDVADEIVVLADGAVAQVGSPHEIYDNPANPFVMSFLGPVTRLGSRLVRPHDIEVSLLPQPGSTPAAVTRIVPLGFEVRVEAKIGETDVWAQLTRTNARQLDIKSGDTVHFRPAANAQTLEATSA
jgi:sulfate transport system ATP-binding protein